jgi:hypothetical protein
MPLRPRLGPLAAALAFILSVPAAGSAQSWVYFHAGATLSNLAGDDVPDTESRMGLDIGGAATFPFGVTLTLQAGLSYIQKGANITSDEGESGIQIDYLEIPVLLKYAIQTGGSVSPHLFLGPTVAFKLGCSLDIPDTGFSGSCGEAGVPPVQSIDFGAMGGAGVEMATSDRFRVTIDALYNYGLRSIDDSPAQADVKNRTWSFVAGVAVPVN